MPVDMKRFADHKRLAPPTEEDAQMFWRVYRKRWHSFKQSPVENNADAVLMEKLTVLKGVSPAAKLTLVALEGLQ